MATWNVCFEETGEVVLTFEKDGARQTCGRGPATLWSNVLAFVADSSTVFDVIRVEGQGTFVRVVGPSPATRS
jgi:hypothetical protein